MGEPIIDVHGDGNWAEEVRGGGAAKEREVEALYVRQARVCAVLLCGDDEAEVGKGEKGMPSECQSRRERPRGRR